MKKKLSTIILVGVTLMLLMMVIYIGTLLMGEKPTPITTIKKTKASSVTYSRTFDLSKPNIPVPSVTSAAFSAISPTQTLLAQVISPSVTPPATVQPTITQRMLPITGRADYTATIIALASLLIFISFIY